MRKLALVMLCLAFVSALCGCGVFFDEPNYVPTQHAYGQGRAF